MVKTFLNTYLAGIIFFCVMSYGQDAKFLTFDESLNIALEESYSIKCAQLRMLSRRKNVEAARAGLKSYAYFESNLPEFDQSIAQEFNPTTMTYDFYRTQQLRYESSVTITQPLPTDGKFSVNGSFLKLIQTGGIEDYQTNLFLKFTQPVFTYNRLKTGIRHAELQLENERLNYVRDCFEIIEDVTENFFKLFTKTLEVKIIQEEVFQRESSLKTGLERVDTRIIDEIEVMQLEIDLAMAKDRLIQKSMELENMEDEFKQLIGLEQEEDIEIVTNLEFYPVTIDLKKALEEALKNRIDIRRNKISEELIELWIKDSKSWNEFKGEITASYGLNKADERFQSAFNDFDKSRSIVFKLSIPLWDWGRNKARVSVAETSLKKHQSWMEQNVKMIKVQVMNSYSETLEAIDRLNVVGKNQELALKSYEMTREEYNKNLADSETLNLAQKRLTDARQAYVDAFVKYKNSIANLNLNSTWDFEKNRSLVNEIYNLLDELENGNR